jgi:uncharacterized protein (DUF885 family)
MLKSVGILLFVSVFSACQSEPAPDPAPNDMSKAEFSVFVDDYFKAAFEASPSFGTASGFHEYDSKLNDMSRPAVERRIVQLKDLQGRLARLRESRLSAEDEIDAEILDHQIRAELLDLEVVQSWRHNPMGYAGLPGSAIDGLIKRDFAPAEERLRSVVARLQAVPGVLDALKENIENPPREFTDLAIRIARGSVGFFKETVPSWVKASGIRDEVLLRDFEDANSVAQKSFESIAGWMEKELLPRSMGGFAIGQDTFSRKLLYEEMVDTPLKELLAIGEQTLERDYHAFIETAKKIDPTKSPDEVMKQLENDHPTERSLILDARGTIESIRQFLIDRRIVTLPSEIRPTIMETPGYMRDGGFAFMDTPGAFETRATESFYYITPPDRRWSATHKEEHLRLFNSPVMKIVTIHEAFPGHFVQFLYASQFPTKTRKLIGVASNAEGWAHYAEQMMVEEGYGAGDPKIQLAQLSEALLRDCRFVVGIKLHTEGWTVEQGTKFFVEMGFQLPSNAFEEARRGAYNPTYLYYTLGKLQIYKLREDYKAARGANYSLENFHDEFVKQGSIPIRVIRQRMLPGNNGPML